METDLPFYVSCELESLQEDSSPHSQLTCMEVLQSGLTCFENIFAAFSHWLKFSCLKIPLELGVKVSTSSILT